MRVLFVQSDSLNGIINAGMHIYNFEPLGLYYLAGSIKEDHDVDLIDLICETMDKSIDSGHILSERVSQFKPDVVCFSAFSSVRTGRILNLASIVKEISNDVIVIVGGVHAALMPFDFQNGNIDFVITKNSIDVFKEIVDLLAKGEAPDKIRVHIDDSRRRNHRELCNWQEPFRELGSKYKDCYQISIGKPGRTRIRERISSVKTSLGCPYRCNFCCLWQLYPKYEKKSVEKLILEIQCIDNDFIFFADDESLIDVKYMMELADTIKAEGIKKRYVMYARSDTVERNPQLLDRWAQIGLAQVWIGLEGSTDLQLKRYNKNNDTVSHEAAIRIARTLNVDVHATALVDDSFRELDFQHLLQYTRDFLGLTSCHFFVLTPFKGTLYYRELMSSRPHDFLTHNPDHYSIRQSVVSPRYLSIEKFHQLYADLQRDFNSDTISFRYEGRFHSQVLEDEFRQLREKNETLYRRLLTSQSEYVPEHNAETTLSFQGMMTQ